ncbi:hypothetical protein SLA2020_177510 [Shorea laevis]
MASYGVVESTLKEILEVIKPLRDDWFTRFRVIEELSVVVQSLQNFRGATVEPFGSFVSNLFTRWGDLDISIELTNGSHISSAGKKQQKSLLEELHKALRQRGGWRKLQLVAHARVPLLKFVTNPQGISCDISIDNIAGQIKSKFLFWINEIDARFRDMVLLVKEWAKAHDINDPRTGTLNSYSLSLLVIFHFQTCVPAILPPLKYLYPGNIVDDLTGLRVDAERHIEEVCRANIAKFKSDKSRTFNRSSLSELFVSFIAKFCDINLKAQELGICPFNGQWEDINSNTRWLPKNKPLFIEDPFEQPENTARTVRLKKLTEISEAFKTTHRTLVAGNQTRNSLLSALARPHIYPFIISGSVSYPSYNDGRNLATHPQAHWAGNALPQMQHQYQAVNSPSQVQHQYRHPRRSTPKVRQFQNKKESSSQVQSQHQKIQNSRSSYPQAQPQFPNSRPESHPISSPAQRPANPHHGQAQMMWRPKASKSNS